MIATAGWDNLSAWPAVVLIAIGGAAFVIWAYAAQVRVMQPSVRWVLPALRSAVMLVLLVSILHPVVSRSRPLEQRGAVLMIVDASGSMGVTDDRPPSDRMAVARTLGRIAAADDVEGIGPVREQVNRILTALESIVIAEDEARLARANARDDSAPVARVAAAREVVATAQQALGDMAGSAGLDDELRTAVAGVGTNPIDPAMLRSRLGRVRRVLMALNGRRDAQLYRTDPAARSAADAATAGSRLQLATDAADAIASGLPTPVPRFIYVTTPTGDVASTAANAAGDDVEPRSVGTDTRAAVVAALARFGDEPVRGVVVLSDGRQVSMAQQAGSIDVPVFTVNVAGSWPRRDVSVEIIEAPQRPFVGESVTFRARVRTTGQDAAPLQVRLQAGPVQRTQTASPTSQSPVEVDFIFEPTEPGLTSVTVSVDPQTNERTDANNVATHRMRVLGSKLKVAAYAGSPTWDFQYLRNALQRSAWADLREGIVVTSGATLAITPQQILEQDAIVLCDVDVGALDASQWDALSQLVSLRGGSVVILANDERVLNGYARQPQAASLLPQVSGVPYTWRLWAGERPTLRVTPSAGAAGLPHLQLTDAATTSMRRWQELPPLYRVLPFTALKASAQPLLIETESGAPVMTEMRLGAGRTMLLGLNETWRWRAKVGERDQDRFFLQMVRRAAGEPYAVGNGAVSIDVDAATLAPSEGATVRLKLNDTVGTTTGPGRASLSLTRDGQSLPALAMNAVDARPGHFELKVEDLMPGRYEFSLDGHPDSPRLPLDVAVAEGREMHDASADPAFLKRLAESTGGDYATLETASDLVPSLVATGDARYGYVQVSLWDSPYLFAIILAGLSLEWALRKRYGLA